MNISTAAAMAGSPAGEAPLPRMTGKRFAVYAALWIGAAVAIRPVAHGLVVLSGLDPKGKVGDAVEFFLADTVWLLMLMAAASFGMKIINSYFTPERAQRLLAGRREYVGNLLAALFGVVTPFCSCSAVPIFIGFVEADVPLGVTFSFLISAPMVNEIALVVLVGMLGWMVAALFSASCPRY